MPLADGLGELHASCSVPNPRYNFGFITYRYTCDAFAALENGHTLRKPNEPQFELCFGGQKQFSKSNYTDLGKYAYLALAIH